MGQGTISTPESMADMLRGIEKAFPGAMDVINSKVADTANAQLRADRIVSPGYAELQTELYKKYGPVLNEIGSQLARKNQMAAAAAERDIARGPGAESVTEADKLQRTLDPEFYAQREKQAAKMSELLAAMDPSKLSNAELENVSRSLGTMNLSNPQSAIDTVAKAMTFGDALNKKQERVSNILQQTASQLPLLRSGMTGFEIATKRPLISNSGDPRFMGAQIGAGGQNTFGVGNNMVSQAGALARTDMAKRKDAWDKLLMASQAMENFTSSIGNVAGMGA